MAGWMGDSRLDCLPFQQLPLAFDSVLELSSGISGSQTCHQMTEILPVVWNNYPVLLETAHDASEKENVKKLSR